MSHDYSGLELEDLTPKQLRKLLKGSLISSMTRSRRKDAKSKDEDDDDYEDIKENDDLVSLHREKTGDSKSPAVTQADLPKGVTMPETEDDSKKKDKKKFNGQA
jgi:hypothetical protein